MSTALRNLVVHLFGIAGTVALDLLVAIRSAASLTGWLWGAELFDPSLRVAPSHAPRLAFACFVLLLIVFLLVGAVGAFFCLVLPLYDRLGLRLPWLTSRERHILGWWQRALERQLAVPVQPNPALPRTHTAGDTLPSSDTHTPR